MNFQKVGLCVLVLFAVPASQTLAVDAASAAYVPYQEMYSNEGEKLTLIPDSYFNELVGQMDILCDTIDEMKECKKRDEEKIEKLSSWVMWLSLIVIANSITTLVKK